MLAELSVQFSPRFSTLPIWGQIPLLMVCLVPLALLAALYLTELRLVLPGTARWLAGVRVLTVATILAAVLFQPVLIRSTQEVVPGRVVVAVDRSSSMGLTDPQRPAVEKLRLARALGLARDVCPDGVLDSLIAQLELPNNSLRIGSTRDSERLQLDAVIQRMDGLTRKDLAAAILEPAGLDLLAKLRAAHRVDAVAFAGVLAELPATGANAPSSSAASDVLTDLRLPLQRGQARTGLAEEKTLAVVLLTDGQHNAGGSPFDLASDLGKAKLPVYAIPIGSTIAPADIAIVSARAPASVFKGAEVVVEARVQVNGLSAREIAVELRRPGQSPVIERVKHDGANQSYTVRLQTRLEEVGTQPLTVFVKPALEETRLENNSRPFAINVADDQARALLVDGEARWEFHYLASAMQRDKSMVTQTVVFGQPRLGRVPEEDLERSGNPRLALPQGDDSLSDFDCVVIGDVTPEQLPPTDRQRLEQYVGERGGTVVFVAGKRAMPQRYLQDAGDSLARLLPITAVKAVHPREGFGISLTGDGRSAGFLQLEPTAEASEGRWLRFPPHFWGLTGTAKPGASVLATPRGDKPFDTDGEKANALIVRQNFGFGRVLYVGLDSTWRWRFKAGDAYHHRFWGQVMRWAASDKPLVAGNEHLRFGTRQATISQGSEVDVVARLTEATQRTSPDALVGARVVKLEDGQPDQQVLLAPLSRADGRPRELQTKLRDLPPGKYAIELLSPALNGMLNVTGEATKLRATFAVTPAETAELVDVAVNGPMLEEIAQRSGGKVFDPTEVAKLIERLTRETATRTVRWESRLWQSWWLLGAIVGLVTLEWVSRKWAGLP